MARKEYGKISLAPETLEILERHRTTIPGDPSLSKIVHQGARLLEQYGDLLPTQTTELLQQMQQRIPIPMTTPQILHLALLALNYYDNPLDAARGPPTTKKGGHKKP